MPSLISPASAESSSAGAHAIPSSIVKDKVQTLPRPPWTACNQNLIRCLCGADYGIRTRDILFTRQVLYQLS